MSIFVDGNPPGCACGPVCGFPCWQRVGHTAEACCPECPPIPVPLEEPVDDDERCEGCGDRAIELQPWDSAMLCDDCILEIQFEQQEAER